MSLGKGTVRTGKVNPVAVEFSVEEEGVRSKDDGGDGKHPCKTNGGSSCGRTAGSRLDLAGCLLETWEDILNVFTSRGLGPADIQAAFTLGRLLVDLVAKFVDLKILVVVPVVVIVVVLVVVVVVVCKREQQG